MANAFLFFVLVVAAAAAVQPSMPTMPLGFSTDIVWWLSPRVGGFTTKGWWFYQQSPLLSIHVYPNSSEMFYCFGTGRPLGRECQVYSNTQKRYVLFPDQRWCCHCCDADVCAGPLQPDWLVQSGAKFARQEKVDGKLCNVWSSVGAQFNLWYTDANSGAPVLFAEFNVTDGVNIANTTYVNMELCRPSSYFTDLPDYCQGTIPQCEGYCQMAKEEKTVLGF